MYTKLSRYISYLLRHKPESLKLNMNNEGWVNVDELIEKINNAGEYNITYDILKKIVVTDDKQRYSFSKDEKYIRANQGPSIKNIDIGYTPVKPPDCLFHGTAIKFKESINKEGITSQSRQFVHLSTDLATAKNVGQRHGIPYIIMIDTKTMYNDGNEFFCSENGVWLTHYVDPKYFISMGL